MNILSVVIMIFVVLETANIVMLYFTPGTRRGNGMGVFNAYEKSKNDSVIYPLVSYLINWVAGTKLIFISLLIVIVILGNDTIKLVSIGALILSISSFYWRLYPIIKSLDKRKQISPVGYSKTLGVMIAGFISIFLIAAVLFLTVFN
ncbi:MULTISPECIES: hypothetical protein [unclassified Oceanispirochaeta]|uniref:hypothetical protein n=1 Tax=unclassified Oceanispirochaeta TaxID=2635722 RepID=UPI000E099D27|nr:MULTISPECIES: hypothetical protein [unclassified Oceanispirochaeta]MBF9014011.1 hypothetical protein [Oceanispirochaeta sp. M2]NPD70502.1 hypothetical protein [Oceanispirochaeta sp. M1]RDG34271.1 hypothetical protein DV872_00190 [Oceanispirochaeta sp. M1]